MSATYEQALAKAMSQPNYDPHWASTTEHARDLWPMPGTSRRRCPCGCGKRATWIGGSNGISLVSGCELRIRRWVRTGSI